jgi:hypothetical protein
VIKIYLLDDEAALIFLNRLGRDRWRTILSNEQY